MQNWLLFKPIYRQAACLAGLSGGASSRRRVLSEDDGHASLGDLGDARRPPRRAARRASLPDTCPHMRRDPMTRAPPGGQRDRPACDRLQSSMRARQALLWRTTAVHFACTAPSAGAAPKAQKAGRLATQTDRTPTDTGRPDHDVIAASWTAAPSSHARARAPFSGGLLLRPSPPPGRPLPLPHPLLPFTCRRRRHPPAPPACW